MKKIFTLFAALVCMMCLQAQTVEVAPNGDVCTVTVNGTTYENLSVTPEGDIHLVTINRDDISLLVRYTDTNTVSAIGTINGQPFQYASDAVAAYAKGFQIPNSDFEEWHQVYSKSGTVLYEPGAEGSLYSWHGFGTCYTTMLLFETARTASKLFSFDTNTATGSENHNTGKCAVVEANSVWGKIANGTMTTGRLQAGNATAESPDNHSEMDISKNYNDDYARFGPFYVSLYAKPDAIKSSLMVALQNANHHASLSAAITDGNYYQEPIPNGTTYNSLIASAKRTDLPTSGWQDYTIPFVYSSDEDPKAIMVTISTNANPGVGTKGDRVYVDDVELIYNAAISNIALNGVTLEGFNFDAATKSYDLTYSGEVMNLTAANFDVTTEGQSAIVVKNVENLGCGNYRIAIGVTSPDFKNGDLYTINVTHNPLTGKLYILGDVNGIGWHANNAVEMEANENQTVFTADVTTSGYNNYFRFATKLAENDDQGSWDYIVPFTIGATENNHLISTEEYGTALGLSDWGTTYNYILPAGNWKFTVDLTARTLTVEAVAPQAPSVYILGEVNERNWAANDGEPMLLNEETGEYTAEVNFDGRGENNENYFSFTTELANDNDDGGWAYIAPFRFGAVGESNFDVTNDQLNIPLELTYGGQAFCIPAGDYTLKLNLAEMTLVITKVQQFIPGDVSGDGNVDVADINILVNIILGKASASDYPNANVDGSGTIDVGDINAVVNIILGNH